MRNILSSLLRSLIISIILLLVLISSLIWLPTGSWLLAPVIRYAGLKSMPHFTVRDGKGSLYGGYELRELEMSSGDITLISVKGIALRPDWVQLLKGEPWLEYLEVEGLSSDVSFLQAMADRYSSGESEASEPFSIKPMRISLKDIKISSAQGSFNLASADLSADGLIKLRAGINAEKELPISIDGRLSFDPLTVQACDLKAGDGHGKLQGRLEPPFDISGELRRLPLEAILAFMPDLKGNGIIDSRFSVKGEGKNLKADGAVFLAQSMIMDVPVKAYMPWKYNNELFTVDKAYLKSLSADVLLSLSADISAKGSSNFIVAHGHARNLSMKNLGKIFAPKAALSGEGGQVEFKLAMNRDGDVTASSDVKLPELNVQGKNVVRSFTASTHLNPGRAPEITCSGRVFGGEVRGKGEFSTSQGNFYPEMVFNASNIDTALLAAAFPAVAALAPSGKAALSIRVNEKLSATCAIKSEKLTLSGITVQNVLADAVFTASNGQLILKDLTGMIGKAPIKFSGNANLKNSLLRFDGGITGLDAQALPQLRPYLNGSLSLSLTADGTLKAPRISMALTGQNNRMAGLPMRNLKLSATYENGRLTMPETSLFFPGASLIFQGSLDLSGSPVLNLSASVPSLELKTILEAMKIKSEYPLEGRLSAKIKATGPMSNPNISAEVNSSAITAGAAKLNNLELAASGTPRNISVSGFKAQIGQGTLNGRGSMTLNASDPVKSSVNLKMDVKGVELRPILKQFAENPGVGGVLNGSLSFTGSIVRPEVTLRVDSHLTVMETIVDRLVLSVQSPRQNQFILHVSGKLGALQIAAKGDIKQEAKGLNYVFVTEPLDINKILSLKNPKMKDMLDGQLTARFSGFAATGAETKQRPYSLMLNVPKLTFSGISANDVRLPLEITDSHIRLKAGKALLCKGNVNIDTDVNLKESKWNGSVKVRGIDLCELTAPYMKEGEIVGSADVNATMKGNFGVVSMTFGNGNFETGSGYIHKMEAINKVSKTKKIAFENIRGTFFWDGRDLWLNPGTQATAPYNDPLYRYFAVNGALGVPGTGMKLICKGRFDIKLLDTFLSAIKGAFQYFTGDIAGGMGLGVLKGAVGNMLGIKRSDFQDVSFVLKGTPAELQLLNLKVDKPLQNYLPLETLNKTEQQKSSQQQFKLNIVIPTGRGASSDVDTGQQISEQILDNLFKIGE